MLKLSSWLAAGILFISAHAYAVVEINSADQAALDSIAGIGPATSKAIIDERKKGGNFKDWSDLEARVKGVGEKNAVKLSAAGLVVNGQTHQGASGMKSSKAGTQNKAQVEPAKASEKKSQ